MKCLYHVDWDGRCAAYWVAKKFGDYTIEDFIMIDYGMNVNWFDKIANGETVVIVDYSLEPDEMKRLMEKTKDIIWIDHHISAINKYKDFEVEIPGLRYDGIAGCLLSYIYFFEMDMGKKPFNPDMRYNAPWFAKFIGDFDVWKYEFGDDTKHFILGLDACGDRYPTDKGFWESLSVDRCKELVSDGIICERYRDAVAKRDLDATGFEYEIDGHKALCQNNHGNSNQFGDRISNYDLVCLFEYNGQGEYWSYSFYTEKDYIDVSKIAEAFKDTPGYISGGGHKKASGLQHKEFLFKLSQNQ